MSEACECEIMRLQRRFAECNDAGRWEEIAALFTEAGEFARPSDPGNPIIGREAILSAFLGRPAGPVRRHLVANPVVTITGPDTAAATCRSIVITEAAGGGGTIAVGGFVDRLEYQDGEWRFSARKGFTEIEPVPFPPD